MILPMQNTMLNKLSPSENDDIYIKDLKKLIYENLKKRLYIRGLKYIYIYIYIYIYNCRYTSYEEINFF